MHLSTSKSALPTAVVFLQLFGQIAAQAASYQSCPLIRAYYPAPVIDKSSKEIKAATKQFADRFDRLVETGRDDDFGSVTPNTTSFSVVLYSGSKDAADDPIFFEYHHTAPSLADHSGNLTLDTVFPLGTLTQLFTVYTWLIEMGDGEWAAPITKFLPDLKNAKASGDDFAVEWDEITIGSLAGQLSGIARDSYSCKLGETCNQKEFIQNVGNNSPVFLPDSSPTISNAAFQLLAFAIERSKGKGFADISSEALFKPLNMTKSGFFNAKNEGQIFGRDINSSASGEQAALSLLSTNRDLARAGHAMLSSRLISPSATRRWLQPVADTSNLRNGVGRPWEIYHAGQHANSSILDVYTKTGLVGAYASYFGLTPDLDAGFAILAHDASGSAPDLNVYADIVSLAVEELEKLAAGQAAAQYSGEYVVAGRDDIVAFNISDDGPGLVVPVLRVGGVDLKKQTAKAAGIVLEDLDFRVYPTNVAKGALRQFVAVFQDKSAPVDQGTPTCITWQAVGSLGPDVVDRFVFELDDGSGAAKSVRIPAKNVTFSKSK